MNGLKLFCHAEEDAKGGLDFVRLWRRHGPGGGAANWTILSEKMARDREIGVSVNRRQRGGGGGREGMRKRLVLGPAKEEWLWWWWCLTMKVKDGLA